MNELTNQPTNQAILKKQTAMTEIFQEGNWYDLIVL